MEEKWGRARPARSSKRVRSFHAALQHAAFTVSWRIGAIVKSESRGGKKSWSLCTEIGDHKQISLHEMREEQEDKDTKKV